MPLTARHSQMTGKIGNLSAVFQPFQNRKDRKEWKGVLRTFPRFPFSVLGQDFRSLAFPSLTRARLWLREFFLEMLLWPMTSAGCCPSGSVLRMPFGVHAAGAE
jgi:hypothetical protein